MHHVLAGYNAGMFAFGQSGGGKTYSMFGRDGESTQQPPVGLASLRVRGKDAAVVSVGERDRVGENR